MKRMILLALCIVAVAASAQEGKGGAFVEVGLGSTHVGNYSPVSIMTDYTDGYSLVPTEHLTLGYYDGKAWSMGATIDVDGGNTSNITLRENFLDINAMCNVRRYFRLKENFELEAGVSLGLLVRNNFFDYGGNHESYTRYGASGGVSLGLNYLFGGGHYVGVRATYPYFASLLSDTPTLPTGLTANEKNQIYGYQLMVYWGYRF